MNVSIVIPVFNQWEFTELCLQSIAQCSGDPANYEVVLIDNGSTDGTRDKIISGEDGFNIRILRNEDNLGFPKAINQGIREAKGEVVVVLNNDTVATPNWLEHLIWHLDNGLDIVGARTNEVSGPQRTIVRPYSSKHELHYAAEMLYKEQQHKSFRFYRIVAFCMAFKKSLWEVLGEFDERFTPGNLEDDDFCLRAIKEGYSCGFARDVYVHHFGSQSHGPRDEYMKLLERNAKIFWEKWTEEEFKQLIIKNNNDQQELLIGRN